MKQTSKQVWGGTGNTSQQTQSTPRPHSSPAKAPAKKYI